MSHIDLTNSSVESTPPWLRRVASIKGAASHNAEVEKQVVKLTEEVKDMLREIKIRVSSDISVYTELMQLLMYTPGSKFARIWSQSGNLRKKTGGFAQTGEYPQCRC